MNHVWRKTAITETTLAGNGIFSCIYWYEYRLEKKNQDKMKAANNTLVPTVQRCMPRSIEQMKHAAVADCSQYVVVAC